MTGLLFIDFKKAFDVINHDIVLKKLGIYGATESTVNWFKSYLSERKQYVQISNYASSVLPISDGIPQGSNLGPILFMLFINDLPLCLIHSNLDIYADDVTLSCAFKREKSDQIVTSLTNDLENIVHWSHSNKMAINEEKTKAMLVIGKRQWKHYDIDHNLEISLDGISIEQVKHHKLLGGVQLDENLTFESHRRSL